jgi:hypothetical protein
MITQELKCDNSIDTIIMAVAGTNRQLQALLQEAFNPFNCSGGRASTTMHWLEVVFVHVPGDGQIKVCANDCPASTQSMYGVMFTPGPSLGAARLHSLQCSGGGRRNPATKGAT